jgi:MBOAT membrane-bound O-acyltransferase family protein
MSDVAPFGFIVALCLLGALVATGSRAQRALGIGISLTGFAGPWLAPREHLLVRSTLAIFAFGGAMRATDLRTGRWSLSERVGHALSIVDTRKLVRAETSLEVGALARLVGWEAVGVLSYWIVTRVGPDTSGGLHWAIRWGGGLAFVYTVTEGAYCLLFATYRLAGFKPPALHRHPAASRSVQEFWGRRWNLTVSAWLGETFFRPLARRGRPVAGVLLAFLVSAVVHAYIWEVALGIGMAALMLAYFAIQGALVGLELALGVAEWRPLPARVWTLAWMIGVSPMFTEPVLKVLEV